MDPLGAKPQVVDASEITRWADTESEGPPPNVDEETLPNAHVISPFSIREDLNRKVALWTGDIAMLQVDAVVNPTNESLTDKNAITLRLMEIAGPELKEACKTQVGSCRTGEAKITGGFKLPARHVIHTVGPRYNVRYQTAAESALFNCYRSVMQIVGSRKLGSVAFSVHNSSRRGYPPEEGAHIAIRTIRRFLEHYGEDIDLVVFISDGQEPYYNKVMPFYFPRSAEEEAYAAKALPAALGNEYGEPVIAERTIRITSNPIASGGKEEASDGEAEDDEEEEGLVSEVGSHPFASMTSDHDQQRREQITRNRPITEAESQMKKYQHYLRRARTENFSDMASLGAFYKAGLDYVGRQVVVFVGRQFPAPKVDLSKAMAYFIHVMETVVHKDYILVYFHTLSESENQADSNFFKQLYSMVDDRYKNNLRALYIIHANWWFKLSGWWFLTFTASEVKDKVQYLNGVQYLYDTINPDQIEIPQFVFDFDRQANGTNYYTPATKGDEATGGL